MIPFARRLAVLAIASALSTLAIAADTAPRAANTYLTEQEAAARSARVSNVAYVLDFTLTGKPDFAGTSRIDFDLADTSVPLTIDLDKAKVSAVTVNGKPVAIQYNDFFITIAGADLAKGRNSV
ncbi:MAG TPA: aminopeptidase N, partial [Telluria sp.]|nr:aminopeptidase N [Telluria sp.]